MACGQRECQKDKYKQVGGADTNLFGLIGMIINIVLGIGALFLAFQCRDGFDLMHFIIACCCPICYIPYGLYCVYGGGGGGGY